MKTLIYCFITVLMCFNQTGFVHSQVVNENAVIIVQNGTRMKVQGNLQNQTNGAIYINGEVDLGGHLVNLGELTTSPTSFINFVGYNRQSIYSVPHLRINQILMDNPEGLKLNSPLTIKKRLVLKLGVLDASQHFLGFERDAVIPMETENAYILGYARSDYIDLNTNAFDFLGFSLKPGSDLGYLGVHRFTSLNRSTYINGKSSIGVIWQVQTSKKGIRDAHFSWLGRWENGNHPSGFELWQKIKKDWVYVSALNENDLWTNPRSYDEPDLNITGNDVFTFIPVNSINYAHNNYYDRKSAENLSQNGVNLYPNPVKQKLQLDLKSLYTQRLKIVLIDNTGSQFNLRDILLVKGSNHLELNGTALDIPSGLYFLFLSFEKSSPVLLKFIKE